MKKWSCQAADNQEHWKLPYEIRNLLKWAAATLSASALRCSWGSRPDFIFGKGEKIYLLWYCAKNERKCWALCLEQESFLLYTSGGLELKSTCFDRWWGKQIKRYIKGIYCEIMDLIPSNPFFGIKLGILFLWSLELDHSAVTNQSMWVLLQDEVELWIEPGELLAQSKAADEFMILFLIMQDLQASIKRKNKETNLNPKQKRPQTPSLSESMPEPLGSLRIF